MSVPELLRRSLAGTSCVEFDDCSVEVSAPEGGTCVTEIAIDGTPAGAVAPLVALLALVVLVLLEAPGSVVVGSIMLSDMAESLLRLLRRLRGLPDDSPSLLLDFLDDRWRFLSWSRLSRFLVSAEEAVLLANVDDDDVECLRLRLEADGAKGSPPASSSSADTIRLMSSGIEEEVEILGMEASSASRSSSDVLAPPSI